MKNILNLSVVNFKADSSNKSANLKKIVEYSETASEQGSKLILFPELCLQGYDFYADDAIDNDHKKAASELLSGPSCNLIQNISNKYKITIIFGMGEKDSNEDGIFNSAIVIQPDKQALSYRKIHPFANENKSFKKGHKPLMFNTDWGPIGVGICYDTYQFPELVRHYAHKGCRLYLNPTALVEEIDKTNSREPFLNYYEKTLTYNARVNEIYVASSNFTGQDTINYFGGGSVISGPKLDPFYENDVYNYGGDFNLTQACLINATIDLSLSTRRIFADNPITGVPDYRPDVYKTFE